MVLDSLADKIVKSRLRQAAESSSIPAISKYDPYLIQKAVAKKLRPTGAWKAGGTNQKTQDYFKTDIPYYGPIEKHNVYVGQASHFIDTTVLATPLKGELEIAFLISPELLKDKTNFADLVNRGDIETVVCLEMPWTLFKQPEAGLDHLIADVCGASALICGPIMPASTLNGKARGQLSLKSGENVITEGFISDTIIHPLDVLADFAIFINKHDIEINEPIYLATGGISSCVALEKNIEYSVVIDNQSSFYFTLE